MENPPNAEIEIQPLGSYFETDEEGYVINPASLDKIQEQYKPVVNDIVETYKSHFGDLLKAVYLRGSVAKGQAIENVSDIDTFSYVDLPKEEINYDWEKEARHALRDKYIFLENVELDSRPLSAIKYNHVILNQSLCVYGEPVEFPKMKAGKEMMLHAPNFSKRIATIDNKLTESESEEKIKSNCTWFMKDILRTGFELTMERSKKYTRDLYLCYKSFSEYYPEKEPQMREILHYAINPTTDKEKIKEIRDTLVPWLIEETGKYV